MKNIVKLSVVALTVLSLASCEFGDKTKKPIDSASTTAKVDSNAKTGIDSTKADTLKKDTTKK
jgi:hypothetical protein